VSVVAFTLTNIQLACWAYFLQLEVLWNVSYIKKNKKFQPT